MFSAKLFHCLKTAALVWPVLWLVGLPLAGCGGNSGKKADSEKPKVVVVEVKEVKIPLTASFSGTLAARETVEVRARVSGYLAEILFEAGTIVQAGQVLFKLDDRDLKAALDTAKTSTAKTKTAWENEDATRQRMAALADKGAISLRQRDDAVAQAEEALASYQAAQAEEEKAAITLGYATITAPTTGLIAQSNVEVGSNVEAGNATLMTTIYNIDPIRVDFFITDKEYARIQRVINDSRGRPEAAVFTMLLGDDRVPYQHPGVMEMADPSIDSQNNTRGVRVVFPNPEYSLRPGLNVNLTATLETIDVVTVPEAAVVDQANSKAAYTVDAEDKVVSTPVVIGDSAGAERVILEGLAPGQRVIVDGLSMARPGLAVEVTVKDDSASDGRK